MRLRTASADLAGAWASDSPPPPTEPGTRLALGTRFGSPACVVSPAVGEATTAAARQPSSAGDFHAGCAAGWAWLPGARLPSAWLPGAGLPEAAGAPGGCAGLRVLPLRRNQSDSSESKMGSR